MAARARQVLDDAGRVAAHGVHIGGRDLDQALVQGTLGEVRRAHPGGLERLVGGEEVAPGVRGEALLERGPPGHAVQRAVRLVAVALADPGRRGGDTGGGTLGSAFGGTVVRGFSGTVGSAFGGAFGSVFGGAFGGTAWGSGSGHARECTRGPASAPNRTLRPPTSAFGHCLHSTRA